MRIKLNKPKDEEVKDMILSGLSNVRIISTGATQRQIYKVKRMFNIVTEMKRLGRGRMHVNSYIDSVDNNSSHTHYVFKDKPVLRDDFKGDF